MGGPGGPRRYPASVRLAVGDLVVYGSHGSGPVAARETRLVLGKRQEVVVLALAGGLRVELSLKQAREVLRPLADSTDMSRVQETLGAGHFVNNDSWLKRQRDSRAKLSGGDPVGLAEIIRDAASRDRTVSAKGAKLRLSPGEREVFVKARQLLAAEIALVQDIELAEADTWIDEQLMRAS